MISVITYLNSSIFWDLFSSSTDHKLESPEGFEVTKSFQDLVSLYLISNHNYSRLDIVYYFIGFNKPQLRHVK